MYFALLFAITLAAGLILHGAASLLVLLGWRTFRTRFDAISPRIAAPILLSLRMAPLAASLVVLVAFIIPSFLEYEPRTTVEPVSFTLVTLASVSALIFSASVHRLVSAWLKSRRAADLWLHNAERIQGVERVPVYRCLIGPPVIAVLGVWQIRIFASESVLAALAPEELQAALRHEAVHVRRFDILKKMLLQLAPTFLPGIDLLKPVSAHWSRVCELAADEESVSGDPQHTLHLASALVKVARLAQPGPSLDLPPLSAALVREGPSRKGSLLGYRVRRLVEIAENPDAIVSARAWDLRKVLLAAGCLTALLLAAYPQVLSFTHELLEFLVQG